MEAVDQVSSSTIKAIPQASGSSQAWSRISRQRVEVDIVQRRQCEVCCELSFLSVVEGYDGEVIPMLGTHGQSEDEGQHKYAIFASTRIYIGE